MPFLRIVRGDATPEEIAAIVATLAAVAAARGHGGRTRRSTNPFRTNWNDRARLLRAPVHPAPGAWRRSMPVNAAPFAATFIEMRISRAGARKDSGSPNPPWGASAIHYPHGG